jgi:hypothetical protein
MLLMCRTDERGLQAAEALYHTARSVQRRAIISAALQDAFFRPDSQPHSAGSDMTTDWLSLNAAFGLRCLQMSLRSHLQMLLVHG